MAYFFLFGSRTDDFVTLTDCSFVYDHFQKTRQLARGAGEGKIEFSVDIRCIGTSGKTARSARPKVDLLPHRNIWKRGVAPGKKCTPAETRAHSMHTFALREKDYSERSEVSTRTRPRSYGFYAYFLRRL